MASPGQTLCSLEKSHFNRKPIWTAGLTLVDATNLPAIPPGGSRAWQRTSQTTIPS